MPRNPRIEYPGAAYHVLSRGNRQEPIFRDDKDREIFLDTLGEACGRCGWRVHAFVLMRNHYHLLLETPAANLVAGMKWLQGTYTQRFNARHRLYGHLFQGRYKALPVETGQGEYFSTLGIYIHLNPARAGLFDLKEGRLSDFAWSSYPPYLEPTLRPDWLETKRLLGNFGWLDTADGRRSYRQMMQRRVLEISCAGDPMAADAQWEKIRRGWCLGSEAFRQELLDKLDDVVGVRGERSSFSGQEVVLHDETEAERLVLAGLSRLNLEEVDLAMLPKGADGKKALVWLLKKRTPMGNKWIVQRLHAGHPANIPRHVAAVGGAEPGSRLKELVEMLECED